MGIDEYFKDIERRVRVCYDVAEEARKKNLDPLSKVEVPLAISLAERVVGLISTIYPQVNNPQIVKRILELEKEYGSLDPAVCLKIAEETAKEKFCKFKSLQEGIDAGIRIAFAYITLGVVSSPIEGYTELKLKKTKDGKDYFAALFSGPIRSAGGTGAAFSLVIIDHLREIFGYEKYDPTEKEVKRTVTELYDYHERINNLQYLPTEEEAEFLAKNLPIQVDGEPSEEKEVSNYKDLERIETNLIRGGFCLVIGEGIAQKAPKILRMVRKLREKGFKLEGWNFLEEYVKLHDKKEKGQAKDSPTYIKDLVAGRPVFAHPSRSGAFRLRYGRARNTGYSCLAIHPATMAILNNFLAVGSQLKIELPTKGCALAACDSIDGPIVKLINGSVRKLKEREEARGISKSTEEILYLGDLLVPFGDFANRNHVLMPSGYCEQEWFQELKKKAREKNEHIEIEDIYSLNFEQAREISRKFSIALHPKFISYWSQINYEEFLALIDWLAHARVEKKIIFPYNKTEKERFARGKRALELLGIEHEVVTENVLVGAEESKGFLFAFGIQIESFEIDLERVMEKIKDIAERDVLKIVNKLSEVEIKDKAGTFIGARMGRPEKAKLRKLDGSPNVLFPVGEEGGRLRSFREAIKFGSVKSDFSIYYCKKCEKDTIYFLCEVCGGECEKFNSCPECKQKFSSEKCREHAKGQSFMSKRIDIKHYFDSAVKKLDLLPSEIPVLVKGVRGTSNKNHVSENLMKGIARALFDLQVNKDGTIRYDATELPITHFKPKEIFTSVEKLREMGYVKDVHGKDLENDEQVLEIFPHDIILPCCSESNDEPADAVFMRVAGFIDLMLERAYGLKHFYNIRSREELVGQMMACIAPHNCAAVAARIIGFSKTQGLLASPYIHAACRRDCVHPSTNLFFCDSDGNVFYNDIGNYVEKIIKDGARIKPIDSFGTLRIDTDKEIYALGINPKTHELTKKRIKYFIKGPLTKEWVKITTATNREYTMTPAHKFMYVDDGKFKFKDAKEVSVDDKLPVLENFNFNSSVKSINLIKLFKENLSEEEQKEILVCDGNEEVELHNFSKFSPDLFLRHRYSRHYLPSELKITAEFLRILGYYAAEGYSRINKWVSQVAFRICDKEMQVNLVDLIKKVFNIKPNLGENNTKITICSKLVYYLFKCIGTGKGAYKKRVPSFIFGLDKELVKEYISAYFEGDGSVIKSRGIIAFYSVSRKMLDGIALLLAKFQIFSRYFRIGLRLPGKRVLERYKELGKAPKQHILNHLVLGVYDSFKLKEVLRLVNKKKQFALNYLKSTSERYLMYNHKRVILETQSDYVLDYVKKVEIIKDEKNSYCVEIDWKEAEDRNILWGEQIINTRCDGDEIAVILLLDLLINFSREFLPSHRGGTQDAPLVLNARIRAGEVDDMIFDVDIERELPLELYEAGKRKEHPSKVKISQIKSRVGGNEFRDLWYEYEVSDINMGVLFSNYKKLPSMQEKLKSQMDIVEKIRAVDAPDVARLVIDRHFIRDIRGNLRKFSQQEFRCSKCNEKYRRPPLAGKCWKCSGNIIFTISEGSIVKYLEPALELAEKYNVPAYLKQSLELTKSYIESIFGREKEKQEGLGKWF